MNSELSLQPIGTIRTPYNDRAQAPRQPHFAEESCRATLVLNPGRNFEQALADLDGFEYIWLIAWFHRNKNWKTKVLPPHGPRVKRGVFATRSPHRPNPLGLSVARLLRIDGRTLHLGATDLLDGTPVLDIKPYIPYADAIPEARAGWVDEAAHAKPFPIVWSGLARAQIEWLAAAHRIELEAPATRVLTQDPTPHPYRRIVESADGERVLAIKSWRLHFSVAAEQVRVGRLSSGYSAQTLKAGDARHDTEAHAAFHLRWPG